MDAGEKHERVEAIRAVAKPGAPLDRSELRASWANLREAWPWASPQPGATPGDIARLEAVLGFPPPDALIQLLELSNGAPKAFGSLDLLSADEVAAQWTVWKGIFDDFDVDDLYDPMSTADDRTIAIYTCPYWVPFSVDGGGNHFAIDLAPGPAGRIGQIIVFGPDEDQIRCVAEDLTSFLRHQASDAHRRVGDYEPAPHPEPPAKPGLWKKLFR